MWRPIAWENYVSLLEGLFLTRLDAIGVTHGVLCG